MSNQQHGQLSQLLESRGKAESVVRRILQQTNGAVESSGRRLRVEWLVTSCKDAMTRTIKRHDQWIDCFEVFYVSVKRPTEKLWKSFLFALLLVLFTFK